MSSSRVESDKSRVRRSSSAAKFAKTVCLRREQSRVYGNGRAYLVVPEECSDDDEEHDPGPRTTSLNSVARLAVPQRSRDEEERTGKKGWRNGADIICH